jgi:hypothetical protein
MPVYGYKRRGFDKPPGLLEMKEVSFEITTDEMRRMAAFFIACADEIDGGAWRTSHLHMRNPPGAKIIVLEPPQR